MKFGLLNEAFRFMFKSQLPKTCLTQIPFYFWYTKNKLPQILDVAWSFQHFFSGMAVATRGFTDFKPLYQKKTLTYLGFLGLWAIRLGGYIYYTRAVVHPEPDPRYEDQLKEKSYPNLFMFGQFQGQGLINLVTAIPLYFLFTQKSQEFSLNNYIGLGIAAVGLTGQTISDQQLYNFKKRVNWDKKEVYREGLFKKARHPNLFFDVMTWTGIAVAALDMNNLSGTMGAFVGPAVLFGLMNAATIPITTEEMKKTKPNYDQVIKETNKFYPF